MILVPLKELTQKTTQCDPKRLGYTTFTYVDISSIDRSSKTIVQPQIIKVEDAPSRARQVIFKDDVIVSTVRPNLNSVALIPESYNNPIASTGFCVLRAKKQILHPQYLYYFVQTKSFVSRLTKISVGAGYPAVTDEDILESEIPLTNYEKQIEIALLLQKADRIRRLRRYARLLSYTYLQSVFLEMFGDPSVNPNNWKTTELGEVVNILSGHGFKFSEYSTSGIRLLQIANVSFQEILWDNISFLPEGYLTLYSNLVLHPGDLVMALNRPILGNRIKFAQLENIDCPAILYQRVGKIIPIKQINRFYISGFMLTKYFYEELKSRLSGSDQPYINPTEMVKIKITIPPDNVQEQFAKTARKYNLVLKQQKESESQAEHLYQSLLRQGFNDQI